MVNIPRVHPTAVLVGVVLVAVLVAGCTINVPPIPGSTATTPVSTVDTTAPAGAAAQTTTAEPAASAAAAAAGTTTAGTATTTGALTAGTTATASAETASATLSSTATESTMAASEKGGSTVATAETIQTRFSPGGTTRAPTPTTCAADFTGSPRSGPAPLTITFTALNPCTVWQHMWTYGDGSLFGGSDAQEVDGAIATVTHTYTRPGTYTVGLIDDDGRLEDGESKTGYITVTAPGVTATPTACTADFTGSPRSGPAPLTVTFTALNPCTVWQHMWTYGDGSLFGGSDAQTVDGAIATVTHTYTSPGTYTVGLIDDDGRLEDGESKTGYITVTGPGGTVAPGRVTGHPTILQHETPGLILTTTPAVKASPLVKSPTILQATPGLILTTTPVPKITVPNEIPLKPATPQF